MTLFEWSSDLQLGDHLVVHFFQSHPVETDPFPLRLCDELHTEGRRFNSTMGHAVVFLLVVFDTFKTNAHSFKGTCFALSYLLLYIYIIYYSY